MIRQAGLSTNSVPPKRINRAVLDKYKMYIIVNALLGLDD